MATSNLDISFSHVDGAFYGNFQLFFILIWIIARV
jgi:hypothetical protein